MSPKNEPTKRAPQLASYGAALDKASRAAQEALQKAEDELFSQQDRITRRSGDQAASRAERGMRV